MKKRVRKPGVVLLFCLLLVACEAQPEPIEVPSDVVLDIHVTSPDELWVSTADGAEHFAETRDHIPLAESSKYVWEVTTDSTGAAWLATTGGIFRYGPETEDQPTLIDNVPASTISVDPFDVVWVGTPGYGIAKIVDQDTVTWFQTNDGLPSSRVLSVFSTTDGDIWAGTESGMAILSENQWKAVPALEGLRIFEIAEFSGRLLVGTDKGAYAREDGATWERLPGTHGRVVTAIQAFQGDFILGTKEAELIVYPSGEISRSPVIFTNEDVGLPYSTITSIAARGDDALLLGFFGGGLEGIPADEWDALLEAGP